ncbi:hypothetical protein DBR43_00605 [Pedobacter sp. KBW06]|uniref:iron chaperone n=1 Tax=Pedobacter sp. KBW06 TaxID=2153359 RepID=UPI000F5ABA71|nr:DUF1801 domain-containing protein [Pedobacter sp. KBW06]RQO73942.1 hypothetical protein DBR43_00605 [Pedobacter sp. KBW06]
MENTKHNKHAGNIAEYIAGFPAEVQVLLEQIRETIKEVVPDAEETISYAIPAFRINKKNLVYFAAFKKHIGLYPAPTTLEEFKVDFEPYKTSKGTVQFPLNQPVPLDLIRKIVRHLLKKSLEKSTNKSTKKSANKSAS